MTKREQILQAIADRLVADGFFGADVPIEPTEDADWRDVPAGDGLVDTACVLEGSIRSEDEVIGEGDRFALTLEAAVVYSVKGLDRASRRARRAAGEAKVVELLTTPDRTLGGLCDWLEVSSPSTSDQPIDGAAAESTVALTVEILFTAAEQTG